MEPPTATAEHKAAPGFVNTHWPNVMAAKVSGTPEAEKAMEWLCQAYWPPLYAFVRAQCKDPVEAEDIVQEFFHQIIKGHILEPADPSRGRFRSFLLGCLKHFMSNQWRASQAQKRGGGCKIISIDLEVGEAAYLDAHATAATPEAAFDRQWAIAIVSRARERLRREHANRHKENLYKALIPFLSEVRPIAHGKLAAQLSMSKEAVTVAVHRFRERYGELLRKEVARTVSDPAEVEDEVRHLIKVLNSQY